jgi:hypothetical protein
VVVRVAARDPGRGPPLALRCAGPARVRTLGPAGRIRLHARGARRGARRLRRVPRARPLHAGRARLRGANRPAARLGSARAPPAPRPLEHVDVAAGRRSRAPLDGPAGGEPRGTRPLPPLERLPPAHHAPRLRRRRKLTPAIHRQDLAPFPTLDDRERVLWALARAVLESSASYADLWRRRDRLRGRPVLVVWGLRDPASGRPSWRDGWRSSARRPASSGFPPPATGRTRRPRTSSGTSWSRSSRRRDAAGAVRPSVRRRTAAAGASRPRAEPRRAGPSWRRRGTGPG